MNRFIISCTFVLLLIPTVLLHADGFVDDFSDPKLKNRQALRGDWKFKNGQASCVSDPELYKKFANHGPILRWPCEFTDGTVEFEFHPKKVDRLVFTFNKKGHVIRISLNKEKLTRVFGWIGESSKENKPETIAKEGVPPIADLDGKWVKFKIKMNGDTADLTIGDYDATLRHASIGREKGEVTLSFASGELAVRNVRVTTDG